MYKISFLYVFNRKYSVILPNINYVTTVFTIVMLINKRNSIKLRYFLISILLGTRYICYEDTHQGSFSCKMPFSKDVQSCKEVSNFIYRSDAHKFVPHRWQILYLRWKILGVCKITQPERSTNICQSDDTKFEILSIALNFI